MKTRSPFIALTATVAVSLATAGAALAQAAKPGAAPAAAPAAQPSAPTPAAPGAMPPGPVNPTPGEAAASAPAPTGTDTSARAAGGASLMTGMSVKDNTGALIGEVTGLSNGVATIKMGSDTFTVDSDKLGVTNGAANINATQAELKKMLPPKK